MKRSSAARTVRLTYPVIFGMFLLIVVFGAFTKNFTDQHITETLIEQKDIEQSTVLLNNQTQQIPLKNLKDRTIASINIGSVHADAFDNMLRNYADIKSFTFNSYQEALSNISSLKLYNTFIIQVTSQSLIDPATIDFILEAQNKREIILAGFGNSRSLQKLDALTAPIIWSPEYNKTASKYSAELIFGGVEANSKLSQTISPKYTAGAGYTTKKIRLRYSMPEEVGINSANLDKIDRIIDEAIQEHATPSAVVMVVKDGNVIFNKAYGNHTYGGGGATKVTDIYDLASITKTSATTMAVMKLYEQQKLSLNAGIGTYLPEIKGTNKSQIPVRQVMLHEAGFINLDFIDKVRSFDHSSDSSFFFPVKVADNYYLRRNFYHDIMWSQMLNSPLKTRGKYVYSDLSMYTMKEIVENQSGISLDQFVADQFYKPLGMRTAGFNPRRRFDKDEILPTEQDNYFRKTLLQGYVHDAGAAMANGVSGHAGLFASANDLAILHQMLLNGGTYGGVQYFKPETVKLFTSRQSNVSRRGLGFDRWDPASSAGYPSKYASSESYGHTGFTGTCVWVDPKYNLVYIFLSNRLYPSANNKLASLNIRPRIQDVIYEAMRKGGNVSASR